MWLSVFPEPLVGKTVLFPLDGHSTLVDIYLLFYFISFYFRGRERKCKWGVLGSEWELEVGKGSILGVF